MTKAIQHLTRSYLLLALLGAFSILPSQTQAQTPNRPGRQNDAPTSGALTLRDQVNQWLREGRGEFALAQVQRLMEGEKPDMEMLSIQASILEATGDMKGLSEIGWLMHDIEPDNTAPLVMLARAAFKQGEFRVALGFYRQGLGTSDTLEEETLECFIGAFDSLFLMKDYEAAIELYERYAQDGAAALTAFDRLELARVGLKLQKGDYGPLQMTLASVNNTSSPNATGVLWLWEPFLENAVRDLATAEKTEDAVAVAKAYATKFPNSGGAWFSLATAFWTDDEFDRGFDALRRAERVQPASGAWASRYMLAAYVATRQNDLNKQIEFYEKAMRSGVADAGAFNNLAWGYYLKNTNTEMALALSQQAVQMAPAEAAYWDTLARLQYRSGAPGEALQSIDKALSISQFDSYESELKTFRRQVIAGEKVEPKT